MTGWFNPEIGHSISVPFPAGNASLKSYYDTPNRVLVVRLRSEDGEDRFLVCVGCVHLSLDTQFQFTQLSCVRRDAQSLEIWTSTDAPIIQCSSARVFSGQSLSAWLGNGGDSDAESRCLTK